MNIALLQMQRSVLAIMFLAAGAALPAMAQEQPAQQNRPAILQKKPVIRQQPQPAPATPAPEATQQSQPQPAQPESPAQAQQQQQQQQQAKQQPKAPPVPTQLVGTTTGWVRVCQKSKDNNKEGCSVKEDVVAENGAFLASVAVQEVTGEERRQLIVTTPLGMALQAGLLVRIDNEKVIPSKFSTCLVNGCFSGLNITLDTINAMKKGKNIFITVHNIQGAGLDLTVPLTTFAKAYDGPAMDVQALQESQKKLQEELIKRAEKAREELLKQQSNTGATPKTGN